MKSQAHGKHTITPKLRLRDAAKKTLLSCILKSLWLGINRIIMSTQMILAPTTHASEVSVHGGVIERSLSSFKRGAHTPMPLTIVIIQPRVSLFISVFMIAIRQTENICLCRGRRASLDRSAGRGKAREITS